MFWRKNKPVVKKIKENIIPTIEEVENHIIESANDTFERTTPYINEGLATDGYCHRYIDNGPIGVLVLQKIKEMYESKGYIVQINGIEYKVKHPKYK